MSDGGTYRKSVQWEGSSGSVPMIMIYHLLWCMLNPHKPIKPFVFTFAYPIIKKVNRCVPYSVQQHRWIRRASIYFCAWVFAQSVQIWMTIQPLIEEIEFFLLPSLPLLDLHISLKHNCLLLSLSPSLICGLTDRTDSQRMLLSLLTATNDAITFKKPFGLVSYSQSAVFLNNPAIMTAAICQSMLRPLY